MKLWYLKYRRQLKVPTCPCLRYRRLLKVPTCPGQMEGGRDGVLDIGYGATNIGVQSEKGGDTLEAQDCVDEFRSLEYTR
jgi:hypothetical protein